MFRDQRRGLGFHLVIRRDGRYVEVEAEGAHVRVDQGMRSPGTQGWGTSLCNSVFFNTMSYNICMNSYNVIWNSENSKIIHIESSDSKICKIILMKNMKFGQFYKRKLLNILKRSQNFRLRRAKQTTDREIHCLKIVSTKIVHMAKSRKKNTVTHQAVQKWNIIDSGFTTAHIKVQSNN